MAKFSVSTQDPVAVEDDKFGELHHAVPVDPNPPEPRAVPPARLRSVSVARATAAKTIWAIRAPRRDDEVVVAEIDQQHLDLAAIVAVDGARRIEARDAVV